MDLFARLHAATVLAGQDNDLPDFLAERLLAVASSPHCYPDAAEEILTIIDMLPLYDTYAQTGYMGMGVNNAIRGRGSGGAQEERLPAAAQAAHVWRRAGAGTATGNIACTVDCRTW